MNELHGASGNLASLGEATHREVLHEARQITRTIAFCMQSSDVI